MARYTEKQKAALDTLMKDEVYEHAMRIIVDEDLNALTMDRLATEVGVSRGTLYNYFSDKDAVVEYLDERTFDPIAQAAEEISRRDLPASVRLTKIAEWIFGAVFADRALIMALSPTKYTNTNRACKERHRARALGVFKSVFVSGIENGEFRHLDPNLLSEFFLAAISGIVESMSLSENFRPPDEIVPTLMEVFLGGLKITDDDHRS